MNSFTLVNLTTYAVIVNQFLESHKVGILAYKEINYLNCHIFSSNLRGGGAPSDPNDFTRKLYLKNNTDFTHLLLENKRGVRTSQNT